MSGAWQQTPGHFPWLREFWVREMGDLMQDAVLLARARGGRNKPRSRRHALRLTLLGDFADENYPKAGREPDEIRSRISRFLSEGWTRF